jgi:type IV secretory pathway TrbD component
MNDHARERSASRFARLCAEVAGKTDGSHCHGPPMTAAACRMLVPLPSPKLSEGIGLPKSRDKIGPIACERPRKATVDHAASASWRWGVISIPNCASRNDHTVMTPFQQSPHSISSDVPNVKPQLSSDDTGDGLLMFVVFIVAVLASTAAVVLIALLDEWWVVGFGFAIHMIVTAIVVLTIVQAMGGSHRSIARRNAVTSSSGSAPSSRAGSERAAPAMIPARVTLPATALDRRTHQLAAHDDRGSHQPTVASARRDQASSLESDGSRRRAGRVLVVTDETLASANEVPQAILDRIEEADDVYVVAPTLTTWLQSLTGDIDGARASADARLRTVFDHMDASGLESHGKVGDEDQVAAVADALDGFSADLVLLRLHARGSQNENWREHRLVDWVRTHTTVLTIVFYFDEEGQLVRPEDAIAPVADAV